MKLLPGFMYFTVKGMIKNTIFIIFKQKLCNGGHLQKKFKCMAKLYFYILLKNFRKQKKIFTSQQIYI